MFVCLLADMKCVDERPAGFQGQDGRDGYGPAGPKGVKVEHSSLVSANESEGGCFDLVFYFAFKKS